ncbi:MAG: NAD(P)-binding domain-containing protein [Micrococcales bacterium]|nr:NAD(P)-binding domain-containing protein [Micrococcales bacterium]
MALPRRFEVGLTADGFGADGNSIFGDLALERLDAAGIAWRILPEMVDRVTPEAIRGLDAVLAFAHLKADRALALASPQLGLIARFGAGYDGIDLDGLAREGVAVTNTPIAVRRPMAMVAITYILALAHQLMPNHRAVVLGDWTAARGSHRGLGLSGRVLGVIGYGGIGQDVANLGKGLGLSVVASEPSASACRRAEANGVPVLPLSQLAAQADFVVVCASLTDETRHLIDGPFIDKMKASAFLINIARGEVVDSTALRQAVMSRRIAGAGLDVFDPEPPAPGEPLLTSDQVLWSPHCLAWTDDFTEAVSASVIGAIVDAANGRRPAHVLNPSVFETGWRLESRMSSQSSELPTVG